MSYTLQDRVVPWMEVCFGKKSSKDHNERNLRFIEEALKLVQACNFNANEAHYMVDYVFNRPVGEKKKEVGGTMVTLAALCLAHGIDMQEEGDRELDEYWKQVVQIRKKQKLKPRPGMFTNPKDEEHYHATTNKEAPWKTWPLINWNICGMHHYTVEGDSYLYVAMVKEGRCISAEGLDNAQVWERLRSAAESFE